MIKNKVQLIGQLLDEPVFTNLENGRLKADLKLTILTEFKDEEGQKLTDAQTYPLICWGKIAEFVKTYLVSGIEMAIDGRLINVKEKNKEGIEIEHTCVEVHEMLVLSRSKK